MLKGVGVEGHGWRKSLRQRGESSADRPDLVQEKGNPTVSTRKAFKKKPDMTKMEERAKRKSERGGGRLIRNLIL